MIPFYLSRRKGKAQRYMRGYNSRRVRHINAIGCNVRKIDLFKSAADRTARSSYCTTIPFRPTDRLDGKVISIFANEREMYPVIADYLKMSGYSPLQTFVFSREGFEVDVVGMNEHCQVYMVEAKLSCLSKLIRQARVRKNFCDLISVALPSCRAYHVFNSFQNATSLREEGLGLIAVDGQAIELIAPRPTRSNSLSKQELIKELMLLENIPS